MFATVINKITAAIIGSFILSNLVLFPSVVIANPQGGQVAAGQATIQQRGKVTTIQQSSDKAVINWQRFNIDATEQTTFQQPSANSITLNRINANNGVSKIFGKLTANGRIILLNQAGILFGPSARIDVAGLIATTAKIRDDDFMNGRLHFRQSSLYPNSSVINQGHITVKQGGLAALVAPGVENQGIIEAHMGTVVLGTGNQYTIDFYGDDVIHFGVGDASEQTARGISNSGSILADGGRVILSANNVGSVVDNAINMSGYIRANTVQQRGGEIVLAASGANNSIRVSGTIEARGTKSGQKGGSVKIAANQVLLTEQAKIDVSGKVGGGTITIGQAPNGDDTTITTDMIEVSPEVLLVANAIDDGNGGTITLIAETSTKVYGDIEVRGGQFSGNGGFVEISSSQMPLIKGIVDGRAPQGETGMLLIDPDILIIDELLAAEIVGLLDTINVSKDADTLIRVLATIDATTNEFSNDLTLISKTIEIMAPIILKDAAVFTATASELISVDISTALNRAVSNWVLNSPTIELISPIISLGTFTLTGTATTVNVKSTDVPLQNAFDVAVAGATINLDSGLYNVINFMVNKNNITLKKSDTALAPVIISGGNVFGNIFFIDFGIAFTIADLTIRDGNAALGSIFNAGGILTVNNVLFTDNTATNGGGILSDGGQVIVNNSQFINNTANSSGGAIEARNGAVLTVNGSTFTGNIAQVLGGAIRVNEATATINNGTFTNNIAQSSGGAINIEGTINNPATLTVSNSRFEGNQAAVGGAIENAGTTTISNSQFVMNEATGNGGAIHQTGNFNLTIADSLFQENIASNSGGAISHISGSGGNIVINNTDFIDNLALGGGGAIVTASEIGNQDTIVTINDSLFRGNQANHGGGAILNLEESQLFISNSVFDGNRSPQPTLLVADSGGAISNLNAAAVIFDTSFINNTSFDAGAISNTSGGALLLVNSLLSNNSGGQVGGIKNASGATLIIVNSTLSGNIGTAVNAVGALLNTSTNPLVLLLNATIAENRALQSGGIGGVLATAPISLQNTIIAKNSGPITDVSGIFISRGNNLIGDGTNANGFVASDIVGTTANPENPGIGPLADNGGPTLTHNLLKGSKAIDGGNNNLGNEVPGIDTDQRGFMRIQDGNNSGTSTIDIGAVEYNVLNTNDLVMTADNWTLFREGPNGETLTLIDSDNPQGAPLFTQLFAFVEEVFINGNQNANTLTIDFSGGVPIPINGAQYIGAGPLEDVLVLLNGAFNTIQYVLDNSGNGFILLDNFRIDHANLFRIQDFFPAIHREFFFGSTTSLTINQGVNNTLTIETSRPQTLQVAQPSDSLLIQSGGSIQQNALFNVNKDLILNSTQGSIIMAPNVLSQSNTGNIRYFAAGNILLSQLLAMLGDVSVVSAGGSILDNNANALNITAANQLLLSAALGSIATAANPLNVTAQVMAGAAASGLHIQSDAAAFIAPVSVTTTSASQQFIDGPISGLQAQNGDLSLIANAIDTLNRMNSIVGNSMLLFGQTGIGSITRLDQPVFIIAGTALTVGGSNGSFMIGSVQGDGTATAANKATLLDNAAGDFLLNGCPIPGGCQISNRFTTLESVWAEQRLYRDAYLNSIERARYRLCNAENDQTRWKDYRYSSKTENTCVPNPIIPTKNNPWFVLMPY